MSRDDLSARERAVLFALLGVARPIANPDLEKLIGFPLDGRMRQRLNDRRYVESSRPGRAYTHELSDAGWRWCAAAMTEGPSGSTGRSTGLERAHALVLAAFARHLAAARLSLADVIAPDPKTPDLETRVLAGYQALARPGEFVPLRALRERLADIPRPQLDAALAAMFSAQRINLVPRSNQQALTAADRESALRLGGESKHLISIE